LFTIAKDVKFQVEFNPATVAEYRLIGYETRALRREDFNNDAVDAGDVGSGHAVTAIYEITPASAKERWIEENRYARSTSGNEFAGNSREYGFLKIRYKLPNETKSKLIQAPILIKARKLAADVRQDVEFSTAVAGYAQLLRGGKYTGKLQYDDVIRHAEASRGDDPYGYRAEFIEVVRKTPRPGME
jgi:Ca-activated chloride channel family protein